MTKRERSQWFSGGSVKGAREIWRDSQSISGEKPRVHGLTSAASIWVTAALGIGAGFGLWKLGLIVTFLSWLILLLIKKFEHYL